MSGLKQDIGIVQGVGLLSTSLLGTGVFVVPALAARIAQQQSLWAWPLLILLVFPVAITFAILGRHFPSAAGAAHFVGMAFGPRLARVTGWLYLSVIPVGVPAALQIATGFWQAAFGWHGYQLLLVQLATLLVIGGLGMRSAGSSATIQTLIAVLVVILMAAIWWRGDISVSHIPWPPLDTLSFPPLFDALTVMFWCFVGMEAFAHLATEFRRPERDFPLALLIGMLVAGAVYFACTVVVLHFNAYGAGKAAATSLPSIVVQLFGPQALWVACIIGYLACFASMNTYIQSFARLVWSQAPQGRALARLSSAQVPVNALGIVIGATLVSTLLIYWLDLPLDKLIVYANGIFILIYLLCMLSGWRLLQGRARLLAAIGALLCLLLLIMLKSQSLYALVMFSALWILLLFGKHARLSE